MYSIEDTQVMKFYRHVWNLHFKDQDCESISTITDAINHELSEMRVNAEAKYDKNFDIHLWFNDSSEFELFILKWS